MYFRTRTGNGVIDWHSHSVANREELLGTGYTIAIWGRIWMAGGFRTWSL